MPPRAVKKPAGTAAPKKPEAKCPSKTAQSTKKSPLPKPEPEFVKNVEMLEQSTPVEDTKPEPEIAQNVEVLQHTTPVQDTTVKEEKSIDGKLKESSAKHAGATESAPVSESAPKEEVYAKAPFDENDKGERLELYENVSQSEPEEEEEDEAAAMDLEQDGVAQEDVEEAFEDRLDEGEHAGDEGVDDESIGEEEDDEGDEMEGEGEEVGEEHEGKEEDEQHEVVKERRKRKEFEVFVGGLDKDAEEEDLRKVFSEVGEVVEIRLMMNPQTQKNKGFAFIRYAAVDQAKRACTELKNPQVKGKVCGVSPSEDSDTLFLGNICQTWTKEALREKLKSFGIDNIEDLTLVEDPKNEGMNRGFAFLEFSVRSDAMNAYKRLQKRDVLLGTDKTAKVSFAKTFVEPDEKVMAKVKTVFVDGLPPSWDEDRVREQFKKYGDIDKIELGRNMPSARRLDFGFVTFSTHDAAVACIDGVNNIGLGEGDNKMKVKARLSKPRQKGRSWKNGLRGGYKVGRGRGSTQGGKVPWIRAPNRFEPRRFGARGDRFLGRGGQIGGRGVKRSLQRNSYPPVSERLPRPAYQSNSRGEYGRRDSYPSRGSSSYSDNAPPRDVSRSRRPPYPEESYGRRMDKPYRDYHNISGSKRSYSALEEPTRFGVPATRNSRSRLEYGISGSASRLGRGSQLRYGDGQGQDSYGYGGSHTYGSLRGSGAGGTYSSYGNDYLASGANVC
eukprot:PITA_03994